MSVKRKKLWSARDYWEFLLSDRDLLVEFLKGTNEKELMELLSEIGREAYNTLIRTAKEIGRIDLVQLVKQAGERTGISPLSWRFGGGKTFLGTKPELFGRRKRKRLF